MKITAFLYPYLWEKRLSRRVISRRGGKNSFGVSTKLHFAVFLIYILQKGKHVSTDV